MAYGYFQLNMHKRQAVFHLLFRKNPFKNNYALCCGLESIKNFLQQWHFKEEDIAYLATLTNPNGKPLFSANFLDYLGSLKFTCDIDAIPEGNMVFAHLPLLRIQGPILECQLLESPLLNILNFQTLIATKASRVRRAAGNDEIIEFGLRRAQGPDGALSASRAAYIGGCNATSNVLAGKMYDIPVRGTHAHSWVTAFPSEAQAFQAYATIMPDNCTLLVDTYNTLQGVKNAIAIGKRLRKNAQADLLGIRLDSGDMATLSKKARKLLDHAGFTQTHIIASNSLDEYIITELKKQHATINAWGVGTSLVTAYDQPALDGVYKLAALQNDDGSWDYKLKLSEQEIKVSNPGRHQVRRYFKENHALMDVIYDLDVNISSQPEAITLDPPLHHIYVNEFDRYEDLLIPVYRQGQLVEATNDIHNTRQFAMQEVDKFIQQHGQGIYPVGLEKRLHALKQDLIKQHVTKPHSDVNVAD
jgi:nicotinate phosphoribosyltransferase